MEDVRDRVVTIIDEGIAASGAGLLGFSVMPNHLHIVLRQATRALGWVLQPVLRRIALLIHRRFEREGHVFERRFRSHHCADADHLRRALTYTHLNPFRASLCDATLDFRWSSHLGYFGQNCGTMHARYRDALSLFAISGDEEECDLRWNYEKYVRYRIDRDAALAMGSLWTRAEPEFPAGDSYFRETFVAGIQTVQPARRKDLRDAARDRLLRTQTAVDLEDLRRPHGPRENLPIRNEVIAGLSQEGYPGVAIAQFFRISQPRVSVIAATVREGIPSI